MNDINIQKTYWDSVADKKTFSLPVDWEALRRVLSPDAIILDCGCGYGRTCDELVQNGYRNVVGLDISPQMIARGKALYPGLELLYFDGENIPFPDESFSACTLFAVLTCIATNAGQQHVIHEIHRILRPGGLLYVSDYPLQKDERNLQRYCHYETEFGVYGVFRLDDGGVVRHHDMNWIYRLVSDFEVFQEKRLTVNTMNNHPAEAFQLLARKT